MINASLGSRLSWVGGGAKLVDRHLKFQHWSTPHLGGGYTGVCVMDILSSVHKHFRNILETINCTLYFKKKFSPLSSELPQYIRSNWGPSDQSILYCKRQKKFFFLLARGSPLPLMACFLPCTFSLWFFKRMRLGRCCLFVWCQRGADLPWALKHLYSSQAASQIPHKETQGDNSPPYHHSILFLEKREVG